MTKKDVAKNIAAKLQQSQTLVKQIVQCTLDAFIEVLATDGRLELRNFGVLEVKHRKARTARNPRTGAQVFADEHYIVAFKPGKVMTDRVNLAFLNRSKAAAEDTPDALSDASKSKAAKSTAKSAAAKSADTKPAADVKPDATKAKPATKSTSRARGAKKAEPVSVTVAESEAPKAPAKKAAKPRAAKKSTSKK